MLQLINGEQVDQAQLDLKTADDFLLKTLQANIFTYEDPKNAVVTFENNYNGLCAALETAGHQTKGITIMELYSKLQHFNEVNKPF